ncbi:Mu transposase C-terminal domain-containing protein [Streptomyces sp. C8S0]|uniref:Mu transposase C-terminal domain-containing protein n=1 Tax=Streptomyces sp. C8S0 TaxID=2585716 RepID=UPI00125D90C8|nr:Mu transposase C-terminal domain-containing protein [Streptomyces sp. C8S0]
MLAQALAPMPGRPGWSPLALAERSEMPYADLVACDPRMAGAAARPVIRPRMIVVDHGKIFNSEHFDDVCRMLGINVRPARTRTATDKAVIESTFGAVKKRFSQYVAGYTGSDLARRGKHVAEGPLWSLNELQDLLDEWIAMDWQQTAHDGLRSPFLPGITVSPNRMYATLVAAEGHVPLPLTASENRKLLPFKRLKVTDKGVTIDNRTYNSEGLQEYRNRHSQIPGQGMRWQIRYSPYAPRFVWLYDHTIDDWVEAEFIHQRLISDAWTQWTWEQATLRVLEDGGRRDDQRRIAREVSALRERARRGPDPQAKRVPQLFTGPVLDLDVDVPDPYEGMPDPDPATVVRAPSLAMDAEHVLAAGDTTPRAPRLPRNSRGRLHRPRSTVWTSAPKRTNRPTGPVRPVRTRSACAAVRPTSSLSATANLPPHITDDPNPTAARPTMTQRTEKPCEPRRTDPDFQPGGRPCRDPAHRGPAADHAGGLERRCLTHAPSARPRGLRSQRHPGRAPRPSADVPR